MFPCDNFNIITRNHWFSGAFLLVVLPSIKASAFLIGTTYLMSIIMKCNDFLQFVKSDLMSVPKKCPDFLYCDRKTPYNIS